VAALWPSRRAPTTAARFCDSSMRSRRRRGAGACSVSSAEAARACSPARIRDQEAAEPLPLRGRATVSALEPRDRWSCSKAAMRADRTSAPDRTIFRRLTGDARIGGAECYAGGSVSYGLIGSPPCRYRRLTLLIAISGAVLCCSAIPLRHRRVCASPAITDLSRIALSGDRRWRLRSILGRVKRASKDSECSLKAFAEALSRRHRRCAERHRGSQLRLRARREPAG
jgi:hypothetical protein